MSRTTRRTLAAGFASAFALTALAASLPGPTPETAESGQTVNLERASASTPLPADFGIVTAIDQHYRTLAEVALQQRQQEALAKRAAELAAEQVLAAQQAAEAAAQAAAETAAQQAAADEASSIDSSDATSSDSGESSGSSGPAKASSGISRTVVNGDIVVTQAGQVLDALDVHGRIIVQASNVTISNSIVRGSDGGSEWSLIDASAGQPGLRVYYTEVFAAVGSPYINGVMGSNFELHGVDIHDVIDQVHILGDNVVIDGSYFHDNLHYANDPQHSDGSHDDNVQIQQGSNIRITGNTFSGSHNAGVQVTQDAGDVSNLTISGNRISNGGCSINIAEKGYGPVAGVSIVDNVFDAMKWDGCGIIADASTSINIAGNVFANGSPVGITRR